MTLITTTTPQPADGAWISEVESLSRATQITGSAFADQAGTVYIEQSGDGTNFDLSTPYSLDGINGVAIEVDVSLQFLRVRMINGDTPQTMLRVFVDIRDQWGDFFASDTPTPGGAWVVLWYNPSRNNYDVIGRFDGTTGQSANAAAAIFSNKNGKYAAFLVAGGAVTEETLQTITEHGPGSF